MRMFAHARFYFNLIAIMSRIGFKEILLCFAFLAIVRAPPTRRPTNDKVDIKTTFMPPSCDRKSKQGDQLTTDYIGTFPDGRKFDSTYDRKEPMRFVMGKGAVIAGAEMGTMNMCKGEKRHLIIPPSLGYGQKEYGQIPAGSTLHFDIVLTELEDDPFNSPLFK